MRALTIDAVLTMLPKCSGEKTRQPKNIRSVKKKAAHSTETVRSTRASFRSHLQIPKDHGLAVIGVTFGTYMQSDCSGIRGSQLLPNLCIAFDA